MSCLPAANWVPVIKPRDIYSKHEKPLMAPACGAHKFQVPLTCEGLTTLPQATSPASSPNRLLPAPACALVTKLILCPFVLQNLAPVVSSPKVSFSLTCHLPTWSQPESTFKAQLSNILALSVLPWSPCSLSIVDCCVLWVLLAPVNQIVVRCVFATAAARTASIGGCGSYSVSLWILWRLIYYVLHILYMLYVFIYLYISLYTLYN